MADGFIPSAVEIEQERTELLARLAEVLETPMTLLGAAWLLLLMSN